MKKQINKISKLYNKHKETAYIAGGSLNAAEIIFLSWVGAENPSPLGDG